MCKNLFLYPVTMNELNVLQKGPFTLVRISQLTVAFLQKDRKFLCLCYRSPLQNLYNAVSSVNQPLRRLRSYLPLTKLFV